MGLSGGAPTPAARLSPPLRRRAPGPGPRSGCGGRRGAADGRREGSRGGEGSAAEGAEEEGSARAAPSARPSGCGAARDPRRAALGGEASRVLLALPSFYRLIFQTVPAGSGAAFPLPAAPPSWEAAAPRGG